jgi:hypothetical protein
LVHFGGVPRLWKGHVFLHPPPPPSVAAEISSTTSEFQESQRLGGDSIFVRKGLSMASRGTSPSFISVLSSLADRREREAQEDGKV